MSDSATAKTGHGRNLGPMAWGAGALILVLALGALLWPRSAERVDTHTLLVFDSSGSEFRTTRIFGALLEYLVETGGGPLDLAVVGSVAAFEAGLAAQPDFVFAPDGLALNVSDDEYLPLVVGRRNAPRNLRPRSVLVSRRTAVEVASPWRDQPGRTVIGDSVSLTAVGALGLAGRTTSLKGLHFGPDSYDHAPVLHALRLGGFDHAVVRQWDAERFFAEELLTAAEFLVRELSDPVPDSVLLVSRRVSGQTRLACGDGLSRLGRQQAAETPVERDLRIALDGLHLAGFNLLLEPDFNLVRKNQRQRWLPAAD